jgi:CO/xanthine dehydrogenase Mo-binding subunit
MSNFNPSRRRFIKSAVIAGVSVYLAPLYSRAYAALFEQKILQSPNWDAHEKRIRFRIDGRAKVMGQKVFARDIRAVDMPHWPQQQAHAFILRVTQADKLFEGIDLSLLGDDLQPDRLVTAEDLARDGLAFPAFYGDDMLLPIGKTPAYLGQAVAILIYHDFARFRFAKDKLKFREGTIKYGAQTGPLQRDPWGTFRYVRVGGDKPFDDDRFSSLKDTPIFPVSMKKHLPVWPEGREGGKLDQEGMYYAGMIADELKTPPDEWLVMSRRYTTQSVDTSALEPDNANGWFDAETQTLHLVVPTQSPQEVADEMPRMLAKRNPPVKQLILHPCYTVGYGSKDHFNFPYYGAVAAMYGDGHPVRLANDRFEQFQTALKRHAFDMNYRIAVNRQTGVLQSFHGEMTADGGGRSNFTPSVVMVAATAAQSIYYFPKSDLSAVGLASRAIDAGSARGYGTLQSMAATEMMVDELAAELKIDPIEFRLRNVLKSGMKNTQGAIPAGAIRADEVLEKAAKHEMWLQRAKRKAEFESQHPGKRYGVGFGCVQKDFGTGAENFIRPRRTGRRRAHYAVSQRCRDGHRHVDLTIGVVRTVAGQTGRRGSLLGYRLVSAADGHQWRSLRYVAGRSGSVANQSGLDAKLLLTFQRQQLGVLLLAQYARSGAADIRSWPVAGSDGHLAIRPRWWPGGTFSGAPRGCALGGGGIDRCRYGGVEPGAAGKTTLPDGRDRRRSGARIQPLAVGGSGLYPERQ